MLTQEFPLTINGVRLDTLAHNIKTYNGRRSMAGKRLGSVEVPGVHGVLPTLSSNTFEPGEYILSMWVMGTDGHGELPAPGTAARVLFDKNLDLLFHLFSATDRLLDIRQVVGDGSVRQTFGRVAEAITPDVTGSRGSLRGDMAIAIELPGVFWQDVDESVFTGTASATSPHNITVTTLTGSTAPIEDAIYLIKGPVASGAQLSCPDNGAWIRLNRALTSGEAWRVNSAEFLSEVGTVGMGFDGPASADVIALTDFNGSGARLLTMNPTVDWATLTAGDPAYATAAANGRISRLVLSGSGFGASTQVLVRARKKFI